MTVKLSVAIGDDWLGSIDEVVKNLAKAGLHVEAVHSKIGVVSGSADERRLPQIEAAEGVESVMPDQVFSLPPLSSKVPQ